MALCGEVVNFLGLNPPNEPGQRAGVAQVAIVQEHPRLARMRVVINGVEPACIEGAGPANDAMHLVTFGEEQLGQITAVLAGDARNQCFLAHKSEGSRVGNTRLKRKPGNAWGSNAEKAKLLTSFLRAARRVCSAWSLLPLLNASGHRKREQAPRTLPHCGTSCSSDTTTPHCEIKRAGGETSGVEAALEELAKTGSRI